jgi:hypothetical protein
MTNEPSEIAVQASILCSGYRVGYFTDADIEAWAVQQLDGYDKPPMTIFDLAMLRGMHPIDVMKLLRSLASELPPSLAVETQIGVLGVLFDAKRITLEKAIRGLFALVHDDGMTKDQQSMIYWLDDGYDLAVAGTYGSISQVESEFRSFVEPHAYRLKALEITMFGTALYRQQMCFEGKPSCAKT